MLLWHPSLGLVAIIFVLRILVLTSLVVALRIHVLASLLVALRRLLLVAIILVFLFLSWGVSLGSLSFAAA